MIALLLIAALALIVCLTWIVGTSVALAIASGLVVVSAGVLPLVSQFLERRSSAQQR